MVGERRVERRRGTVAARAESCDERQVAAVLEVGWPLGGVDLLAVAAIRRLDPLDVDSLERAIEAWCIVGRFPRVQDGDEAVDEALAREPGVPCLDGRQDLLQKGTIRRDLVEDADRGREDWRLRQPCRRDVGRTIALGRLPELRPGPVVVPLRSGRRCAAPFRLPTGREGATAPPVRRGPGPRPLGRAR